jgi:hypothetical protein
MPEGFDAFKKSLSVVQTYGSRHERDGAVWHNAGAMPLCAGVVYKEHVVGAQHAEAQIIF